VEDFFIIQPLLLGQEPSYINVNAESLIHLKNMRACLLNRTTSSVKINSR